MRIIRWRHCRRPRGLAGCAGPVTRLLAKHNQSTGLLESGLGLSHRAGAARRTEGAERANGGRSGRNKHDGPVRRCARRNPGEAQRIPGIVATTPCPKTIPDFAALLPGYTPVPLHYRPRDRQRTAQARWIAGCRAAAQKCVARRYHAHQDVAAGIHAAPGRAGATTAPASDPLSRRAGAQGRAACRDRAGSTAEYLRARG